MTQLDEQSGTEVVSPWETPERRALTDLVQAFTRKEIAPYVTEWEEAGELPRELHRSAARAGLLGIGFAEDVGGVFLFHTLSIELRKPWLKGIKKDRWGNYPLTVQNTTFMDLYIGR